MSISKKIEAELRAKHRPEDIERYRIFLSKIPALKEMPKKSPLWMKEAPKHDLSSYVRGNDSQWLKKVIGYAEGYDRTFCFRESCAVGIARWRSIPFLLDFLKGDVVTFLSRSLRFMGGRSWEHAQALAFLRGRGLLQRYEIFLNELGIESSMATARFFYYFVFFERKVKKVDLLPVGNLRFLEIGAGAGNFALLCLRYLPVSMYIIIDLPEMLGNAAYQFLKYEPSTTIVYPHEATKESFQTAASRMVILLTPDKIDLLPKDFFHANFNFTSFSEMVPAVIKRYFEILYDVTMPKGFFYHVNRHQLQRNKDRTLFENHPLLFPYRSNDEHIVWDVDDFHMETRFTPGHVPTPTYMRLSRKQ